MGFQNAQSVQPVVAVERIVFYRERAAGMYSALPYAFGQVVIELPYILLQTLLYGVIVYAMIGFHWTAIKFFWYLFFMYFTLLCFTFYGMMIVAVTPNQHIAAIVRASFYKMWYLFAGFVVPRPRAPMWWRWYFWANPLYWSLYGLFITQFGDVKDKLDTGETVEDFVRDYFGYRNDFVGITAMMHIAFALLFGFTFAYSIKAFNFQKK
ncbi:ABC2_membrane domain-containing protein [Cephalotus follicularis]|uniref:ABC2_membrane domain-containing protein n=1 Tax=Cephalotus follicularis TaxID=3775 RepID=A0A1Q3BJC4_CEPFO|nr:ABC2_membrane domain-containing protein [Cephalotus follicularis]